MTVNSTQMITQTELKSLLSYDLDTGIFRWLASRGSVSAGSVAGCLDKSIGYVHIGIGGDKHSAHRLAWLYVYGVFPPEHVDHINLIKNDNRIFNLREATDSQNKKNQEKQSNNTSGFKCVNRVILKSGTTKWMVRTKLNSKYYYLGTHNTPEEASAVYQTFAKLHHGEFYNEVETST